VAVNGGGGAKSESVTDLAYRRRIASVGDRVPDVVEYLALPAGQVLHVLLLERTFPP
jgi:hypothetical protein